MSVYRKVVDNTQKWSQVEMEHGDFIKCTKIKLQKVYDVSVNLNLQILNEDMPPTTIHNGFPPQHCSLLVITLG